MMEVHTSAAMDIDDGPVEDGSTDTPDTNIFAKYAFQP